MKQASFLPCEPGQVIRQRKGPIGMVTSQKYLHTEEVLGNDKDFSHLAFRSRVDHLNGILSGTDSVGKI